MALLGLILVPIFRPTFIVNDDIFKTFFVMGIGTDLTPIEFMGYSNPLLGHVLKVLYAWAPKVPWYGGSLLLVQALALGAVLRAAWLTPHRPLKGLLFLGAFLCFHINLFTFVQFTITSSLAAQGALLLGTTLWREQGSQGNRGEWTLVGALMALSALVRLDAFFLTLFCGLPTLGPPLLQAIKKPRILTGPWSYPKTCLLGAAALVLGLGCFEAAWYRMDPAWKEFQAFDKERVEMQDYRIHTYDDRTRPFFEKAGWTRNDYEMFRDWYFMDPDRYSADNLRELKKNFPRFGKEGKPASVTGLREFLDDHWVQMALCLTLTLVLLAPSTARGRLLLQLGWALAVMAGMLYFLRLPERVMWPLMALPLGAALIPARPPFKGDPGKGLGRWPYLVGWVFLLVFTIQGLRFLAPYHRFNSHLRETGKSLKEEVARLSPREDQLFIVWDSSFPFEGYGVLEDLEDFRGFHLFTLAVYQRAPNARKMLERFGLRDPFPDMVDRRDVLLICTPAEGAMYQRYMMEKHGKRIYAERYFEGRFFRAYRIHSKPPWEGG